MQPPRGPTISNFTFGLIGHKCGEGGEHLIPLDLVCEKLQRTISLAIRSRFDSFLQRWKALVKLHNLAVFNFYHMLRCIEVIAAMSFAIECDTAHLGTSAIETWLYSHLNNIRKTSQFNNFTDSEWILLILESLKCA